jgi:hypothetical protein
MSLLSSHFREYYMMSDSTVNSVPRRGGANVRFMNEPRDFAGESNKVNEAMVCTMAKKLAANMPKWAGKLPIFTYNALAVLMQ